MTSALRKSLDPLLYPPAENGQENPNIGNVSNAGLELSRYLKTQKGNQDKVAAREQLLDRIHNAKLPPGYEMAYQRWEHQITQLPGKLAIAKFNFPWRVIVGLGAESVLENTITVHRPWGMPFIPGSALKGLANHYVQQVLAENDPTDLKPAALSSSGPPDTKLPLNSHGILFGTTDGAAYINWLDAWYIPPIEKSNTPYPFRRDILTNHHPSYYSERGQNDHRPPWDFDDPNPVPFVSATGNFLVAIQGPDQQWADFALNILEQALKHAGVGAKTSAGYGRANLIEKIHPQNTNTTPIGSHETADELKIFKQTVAKKHKTPALIKQSPKWAAQWAALENEAQRREMANFIYERWVGRSKVLEAIKNDQNAQNLIACAEQQE